MSRSKKLFRQLYYSAVVLFAAVASVYGSGFSILEQSTVGLGRSLAGMSCDMDEPSALFFNPSLSAWHTEPGLAVGGNWLHIGAYCHKNSKSTGDGINSGNGGGWTHVPNLSVVYPLSPEFAIGLSFSATSGTATKWDKSWIGRYESINCEIAVVEATPSIAWKPMDNLSIGAGLIMQYADCKMTRAVPLSISLGDDKIAFPDGKLKLNGDSFALGYVLGISYKPFEHTHLGLSYRSCMDQNLKLEGDLRTSSKFSSATSTPRHYEGDADCKLKLPSVVTLGVAQEINDKLTLMADVSWTKASVFDKLTVDFKKGDKLGQFTNAASGSYSSTTVMNWKDTWRFCLGGEYKWNDKWTFRAGAAYDMAAVRSPELRNSTLPDLDRYWLSCGVSYKWNENIRFDLGYVRIFFDSDKMTFDTPDGGKALIDVSSSTDIFTYSLTYTF